MGLADLPEWERLLAAEAGLQRLDGDHVLDDLRPRFDDVLATLEAVAGRPAASGDPSRSSGGSTAS